MIPSLLLKQKLGLGEILPHFHFLMLKSSLMNKEEKFKDRCARSRTAGSWLWDPSLRPALRSQGCAVSNAKARSPEAQGLCSMSHGSGTPRGHERSRVYRAVKAEILENSFYLQRPTMSSTEGKAYAFRETCVQITRRSECS